MPRVSRGWLIAGAALIVLVLIVALFVRDAQTPRAPSAEPLTKTFDQSPTSFTLKYPDDWEYSIPTLGVVILAPSQTLNGSEPGPTVTVERAEPLSVVGTLDGAITRYLQSGPLLMPGRWQITEAIHAAQFQGQSASAAALEGADSAGAPTLHTEIIATSAKDTFVYLLITTVPLDKQAAYDPTLAAVLASVQIVE